MKEERNVEDYRAAVIALKKKYKNLVSEYSQLADDIKRIEDKTKEEDIFHIVNKALTIV